MMLRLKRRSRSASFFWFAICLTLMFLSADSAAAHTAGKMRLASAPAGPFRLTTWTSPDPARVGRMHVATSVVLAEDASPVLGAQVTVKLTSLDGGGLTLEAPASAEDATNKFLYEAVMEPALTGMYETTISVTTEDGLTGSADFEVEVLPPAGIDWMLLVPVVLGFAAVTLLWLARRSSN